jgi:mRNA interferase RelE/StbE
MYAADDQGDVRKMAGRSGLYRLRVGDWRILFTFADGGRTIAISRVLNRRDAYR